MRPSWSIQLMAVLGSLTAGEIALRDVGNLQNAKFSILLKGT
jgi:hypothetical protein